MLKLFPVLICICIIQPVFSQNYTGKGLIWENVQNPDERVNIRFGTSGRNIGGYEGTTVIIKNLTSSKLYIEVKLVITDFCGKEVTRNIKTSIKANSQIGGSTWMGGSEQYDFSTTCTGFKKYGEKFYTRIQHASLFISKLTTDGSETGSSQTTGTGSAGSPGNTPNPDLTQNYYDDMKKKKKPSDQAGNTGDNAIDYWGNNKTNQNPSAASANSSCPPQGLSVANKASMNCIQLRWFTQSTIQYNEKNNDLKVQNQFPEDFILYYKKAGDRYWKDIKIRGYHLTYNLTGLDPCTKYEIKLQRVCGTNSYSDFSGTIRFSTTCPMPTMVKASNVRPTSATIGSRFAPGVNVCSLGKPVYTIELEYSSASNNWQTVFANPGTGGSVLYNLTPNTSYRVRVRYDYGDGNYSRYSNEILVKTLPN